MATKIHQTGTRAALTFRHADHDDSIVILPTSTAGQWYVIREYGHQLVNLCMVMTADEIIDILGFDINTWTDADKRPFP